MAAQREEAPAKEELRVATWNVEGLAMDKKNNKLRGIVRELCRRKIKIAGLAETHRQYDPASETPEGDYIMYSSPAVKSRQGVAFLIAKEMKEIKRQVKVISPRIIYLKLCFDGGTVHLFQVYAPMEEHPEKESNSFYRMLKREMRNIPQEEMLLIMGDFNAKVGSTRVDDHLRSVVGKYGLGERSERGEKLISFCISHDLTIANTFFRKSKGQLVTWSRSDKARNQIDFVLVRARFRSAVSFARTYSSTERVHTSDHKLLACKLWLRCERRRNRNRLAAVDVSHLTESMSSLNIQDDPNLKVLVARKQPWMSDETLKLILERKRFRKEDPESNEEKAKWKKEIRKRSTVIRYRCAKEKKVFYRQECRTLEKSSHNALTKDLFLNIRRLRGDVRQRPWVIVDENVDNKLASIETHWDAFHENREWTNDFGEIFDRMIERALLQNDKTSFFGIFVESLKRSRTGIDILRDFCRRIWETGEFPKNLDDSIVRKVYCEYLTDSCFNFAHSESLFVHFALDIVLSVIGSEIGPVRESLRQLKKNTLFQVRQAIEKALHLYVPTCLCRIVYKRNFLVTKPEAWEEKLETVMDKVKIPLSLKEVLRRLSTGDSEASRRLSQLFFPIYIDHVVESVLNENSIVDGTVPVKLNRRLTITDGSVIITIRAEQLLTLLNDLRSKSEEYGLQVNVGKTKVMVVDRTIKTVPEFVGPYQVVDRFVYLDSMLQNICKHRTTQTVNTSCRHEIRRRAHLAMMATTMLDPLWKSNTVPSRLKVRLVFAIVFSLFSYACETWSLRVRPYKTRSLEWDDEDRINALENWVWARACVTTDCQGRKPFYRIVCERILEFSQKDTSSRGFFNAINNKKRRGKPLESWIKTVQGARNFLTDEDVMYTQSILPQLYV